MTTATPPAAINAHAVWRNAGWTPHHGQARVAADPARIAVVAAGRRWGKSELGGMRLLPEALLTRAQLPALKHEGRRREFWIVGPEYSDSEKEFRVVYNALRRMGAAFDRPGTYNDPISGLMHVSLFGGHFQVHAKSAKHPERLVGEGLSGVILVEAAKLREQVWTKYVRPALADYGGWALMTSTPEGRNWFYERWRAGQDPGRSQWASWRAPAWTNPHVYPGGRHDDEIQALAADLTEETFNQEIAAEFTEHVGRVFKNFDEQTHVADLQYRTSPSWSTYAAVDYGFTNPFVWLLVQVGPFDEVHVLDELYLTRHTIGEAAEAIRDRGLAPDGLVRFYPDPASPGDTRALSGDLRTGAGGGTGGELKHRLDTIRDALKPRPAHLEEGHPDKRPQLLIDRKCTQLIREMNDYRYPARNDERDTNAPELPLKVDDHGPEALGRFFAGHFGTPTGPRNARVRSAAVG